MSKAVLTLTASIPQNGWRGDYHDSQYTLSLFSRVLGRKVFPRFIRSYQRKHQQKPGVM